MILDHCGCVIFNHHRGKHIYSVFIKVYQIHILKSFMFKLRFHTRSAKLDQVGVRGLSFTRFFGRLGDTAGGVELGRFLYHKYSPGTFILKT